MASVARGFDLKNADSRSDISEAGTGNSDWASCYDSREDLGDFATKLGITDASRLSQDRFRVDRKKLEQMIGGDSDAPLPADIFFEQIMADTETYIVWPCKLKVGAKCKKDPHVKIVGRSEDVKLAKERVLSVLLTKTNRVTMKIDVSYTEHSHIIGREGLSIKRIMEETECHVHFPDSNRSNPFEKSNQVSIAGDIKGVEMARSRVRQKMPIIFGFELPIMSNAFDPKCEYILKLQEQYNVQIMFRTRPKLHATLVEIKGVQWEVMKVKEATMLLIAYTCKTLAPQISVQMLMEISPHHHQMVIGINHANLKSIIKATGVEIMFPDAQDPNIPNLKKSRVTITGHIDNVYAAREMLMGSLPLLLMFDVPATVANMGTISEHIKEIELEHQVSVSIRQKPKNDTIFCIVKGHERAVRDIYKARSAILNCSEPNFFVEIPNTYRIPPQTQTLPKLELPSMCLNQQLASMISPIITPTYSYTSSSYHPFGFHVPYNDHSNAQQQSLNVSSGYHSMNPSTLGSSVSTSDLQQQSHNLNKTFHSVSAARSTCTSRNYRVRTSPDRGAESGPIDSSILSDIKPHGPFLTTIYEKEQKNQKNHGLLGDYSTKQLSGYKAMYQPFSATECRSPTNTWAGYGISHTNAGGSRASRTSPATRDAKPAGNWDTFEFSPNSSALNMSNLLDNSTTSFVNNLSSSKWDDVTSLLVSIGLQRYICLFTSHEIDLSTLAGMNDKDLLSIGITAFGARSKLLLAISEMRNHSKSFSPAPGAERRGTATTLNNSCPTW